ncbi:hypothetical protein CALVIDRAFT_482790, partial [Calocera viscosa TUFC12733]
NLLVVASFGKILPPALLDRFAPNRRLNVHPSLLPHLRGPSPIQTAIYNGDTEIGVSIIGVEKKVDSGDIWAQEKYVRISIYRAEPGSSHCCRVSIKTTIFSS